MKLLSKRINSWRIGGAFSYGDAGNFEILKNELLGLEGKKGRGFINARLKSDNKIEHTVNELSGDLLLLNCFLVVIN